MGNLAMAYQLCVQLCNKVQPPCLYSMDGTSGANGLPRRGGGTFLSDPFYGSMGATTQNPIQYFDCSGMMSYVLWKAGYFENNPCFTTFYEADYLRRAGFNVIPYYKGIPLRKGDILWYNTRNVKGELVGHTEMVYDEVKRQTMGAKGRGTPWGYAPTKSAIDNVAIGQYNTDTVYDWQFLARDIHSDPSAGMKWIYKNEYLSENESWNNASIAGSILAQLGFSMNAICGILGNMMAESGVEPWLTERGGGGGYGLVQWTPKSDLVEVVERYRLGDYSRGDVQCQVFDYECGVKGENIQWYSDSATGYPVHPALNFTDFATWKTRTDVSPELMAESFMCWYERPAVETAHLDRRKEWARTFYNTFSVSQFNGAFAFDTGSFGRTYIYLIDYVRRKNSLKTQ